ncbi:MAG: glucose 1-dehydrogenase [Chloroflexota bacterium]
MAGSMMQAVVVTPGIKDSARLAEVPLEPLSGPGDVLVRTVRVGVCGTDAEINEGLYGEAPKGSPFLILGHESFGRVTQVGRDVRGLLPGDFVVAMVRRPDGCPNCLNGEQDMCLWGRYTERGIRGMHGFMAEYFIDQPQYLLKAPPAVAHVGVLVEPLSVVEKALRQAFEAQRRMLWRPRTALVLGAGPIGLLAAMLLRSQGLPTCVASRGPTASARAQLAQDAGARYVSLAETPLAELPRRAGETGGFDLIIEATGDSGVVMQAMGLMGTNGVVCLTSVTGGHNDVQVDASVLNQSIVLGNKAIVGSVNANVRDMRQAIADLAVFESVWPGLLGRMLSRRVPPADFGAALRRQPDDVKVVVEFGPE